MAVRLRGRSEVEGLPAGRLAWSEGRLTYARFTADKSVSRDIRYSGTTRRLEFEAGQTREIVG
jgi:hypothetical protein